MIVKETWLNVHSACAILCFMNILTSCTWVVLLENEGVSLQKRQNCVLVEIESICRQEITVLLQVSNFSDLMANNLILGWNDPGKKHMGGIGN